MAGANTRLNRAPGTLRLSVHGPRVLRNSPLVLRGLLADGRR